MSQGEMPPADPYTSPVGAAPPPPSSTDQEDATGGLIPYNNPAALVSYYLGIVSLLPVLGFPFGVAAIFLAAKGLKKRRRVPAVRGHIHAWIGMILSLIGMPLHLLFGGMILAAIISAKIDG